MKNLTISEGIGLHKQHTDIYCNVHCATVKHIQRSLCLSQKLTFHKSCSLSDIVQQLVKDGSDCLFSQHKVLQWRDGSFCHYATATKVT